MNEEAKTQQPETTHPEDNGAATGKTFTQEEVNKIVSERLARERDKAAVERVKDDPIERREKDLAIREAALACKEYISSKGLPSSLLDVLDSTDAEKFKVQVDKLMELFPDIDPAQSAKVPVFVRGGTGTGGALFSNKIAEAFRPKT